MFFSDNDPNGRITRASLDGQNATVIVYRGLVRVSSLTVDPDNNLLLWVDTVRFTLEVCHYDGSHRRVIRRTNVVQMEGLQFYQNVLHVVVPDRRLVRGFDLLSGVLAYNSNFTTGAPTTLAVYDTENVPSFLDPCFSAQCGQICVNTPSGPTCVCHDGYNLAEDGRSCLEKSFFYSKGFIISHENTFEMIEISSVNGVVRRSPQLKVTAAIIQSFVVNADKELIYFIDSKNRVLKELDIKTQQIQILTSLDNGKSLVLDWYRGILGWINVESSEIIAFSLTSGNMTTVYTGLSPVEFLTVDPHDGKLFWISGMSPSSIMCGQWDGTSPKSLLNSAEVFFPRGLTFDVTNDRLFWIDGSLIMSCKNNGLDLQTHTLAIDAKESFSYKDLFVWMNDNQLYFGLQSTNRYYGYVNILEKATSVAIYDSLLQRNLTGSCQIANGGCEDICVPLTDGRMCECDIGLPLQNDSRTCKNVLYEDNFILATDRIHDRIIQVDLESGNFVKLPVKTDGVTGIAYEKSTDTIFFTTAKDLSTAKVGSISLRGDRDPVTYATGFKYSESLALDHSTGNIFFAAVMTPGQSTSLGQDTIRVIHRKLFLQKTLLENLDRPRSIALYSSKGLIFWTEVEVERIGKAFMDGTSKKYIVTNKIRWPNGVAIDFTAERLYWTDGFEGIVESSDLNGGDRRDVYNDEYAHLRSIAIDEQFIYYTGYNLQRIMKVNKTSERRTKFMDDYPELDVIVGLQVYSDNNTIDVNPLCARFNGLCSTFCFPTPTGRTCGCQDNAKLLSDQKIVKELPCVQRPCPIYSYWTAGHIPDKRVNLNARMASIEQATFLRNVTPWVYGNQTPIHFA